MNKRKHAYTHNYPRTKTSKVCHSGRKKGDFSSLPPLILANVPALYIACITSDEKRPATSLTTLHWRQFAQMAIYCNGTTRGGKKKQKKKSVREREINGTVCV